MTSTEWLKLNRCPIHTFCNAHADDEIPDDGGYDALLEWMRGDA